MERVSECPQYFNGFWVRAQPGCLPTSKLLHLPLAKRGCAVAEQAFRFPGGMDAAAFLAGYWQRRALFCAQALDAAAWRIEPEDLLSIAMEDGVSARLVSRQGDAFTLESGPFAEERLDRLPARCWSVLVQAMEVWEPRYHGLIALFGFLPRWRIDDIMISLAGDGGGVGPHVDQYDVFLFQVAGRRRWSFGGPRHPLVEGAPLRLLSRFEPEEVVVAEPGDVLYLPPGLPHDGVALGEGCITVSIGFRAPGLVDLADRLAEAAAARWQEEVEAEPRFGDAGRGLPDDPWELPACDIARARAVLQAALDDDSLVARLLGEQVTMPRRGRRGARDGAGPAGGGRADGALVGIAPGPSRPVAGSGAALRRRRCPGRNARPGRMARPARRRRR